MSFPIGLVYINNDLKKLSYIHYISMTSAVRYANKLTHLFFMSCHECMMHKYKKQRLGVYPYWSSSVFTMII